MSVDCLGLHAVLSGCVQLKSHQHVIIPEHLYPIPQLFCSCICSEFIVAFSLFLLNCSQVNGHLVITFFYIHIAK